LVLDGVADEVLKQLNQLRLVRHDAGRGSCVTTAPLSSMAPRRLIERLLAMPLRWRCRSSPSFGPDARIGQQVLDQPLHAAGPVHGERNELVGIGVELPLYRSERSCV
jgi:hypothetical protein